MPAETDYIERYSNSVNMHFAMWKQLLGENHPRMSCIPIIDVKRKEILEEIGELQLKVGESPPHGFIAAKLDELHLYADMCLQTPYKLPKHPLLALESLEKQLIVARASSNLAHEVMNWEKRFDRAGVQANGCDPLVLGKSRQLLNQLTELDDISPEDLSQASQTAVGYLGAYAARCLNEGADAVRELNLPKPYHRPEG